MALGDSRSQGIGAQTIAGGWAGQLHARFAAAGQPMRLVNLSVTGARVRGVLAREFGKKKAAVAVGHSILVICWHLLTDDRDYADLGGDYFTRRNTDRQSDRLIAQLHNLGY